MPGDLQIRNLGSIPWKYGTQKSNDQVKSPSGALNHTIPQLADFTTCFNRLSGDFASKCHNSLQLSVLGIYGSASRELMIFEPLRWGSDTSTKTVKSRGHNDPRMFTAAAWLGRASVEWFRGWIATARDSDSEPLTDQQLGFSPPKVNGSSNLGEMSPENFFFGELWNMEHPFILTFVGFLNEIYKHVWD